MKITTFITRIYSSLLLLALAISQADAGTYKWIDENGKTHYGDKIPSQYQRNSENVRPQTKTTHPSTTDTVRSNALRRNYPTFGNPRVQALSEEEWEQQRKESEALRRKAMESNARRLSKFRNTNENSHEQQMRDYKSSSACFGAARNINGSVNMAVAKRMGCKDMKRPTRD